jgi:hypothetical protein
LNRHNSSIDVDDIVPFRVFFSKHSSLHHPRCMWQETRMHVKRER